MTSTVNVYIYDLSQGLARACSEGILGRQIDGIWHTSIIAFENEYFFGDRGIVACQPGCTELGQPHRIENLGCTQIPFDVFMLHLDELANTCFKGTTYHLFDHNCNTFSSELAQFLTGNDIPEYITSLPQDILCTPFGAMIKPFVDALHIRGGHSPFSP